MRVARHPLPPSKPWIVRAVAEKILAQLEQIDSHLSVQGWGEVLSVLREDVDLRRSELAAAAAIAIAQIREPPAVIDGAIRGLAPRVGATPEELRDRVTAALQDLAADTRRIGELKAGPPNALNHNLEELAREMVRRRSEAEWGEPLVQDFVRHYRELLGVDILRRKLIRDLFYAGDAFRALFERELPVVLVAACAPGNEHAVNTLFAGFYDFIAEHGLQARVSHVGRFSANGAHGAAYRAAEGVESLERIGIGAPVEQLLTAPMAAVHKGILIGTNLGDEVWLFREMAPRGVAVVLGGDDQALNDARLIVPRAKGRVICCGGFGFESPEDLKALTGATDAAWIPNASTDSRAGRRLGALVAEIFEASRSTFWRDPLLSVAFREHPQTVSDLLDGLFENASRNRIVRLITAVSNRLERAGIPPAQAGCDVSDLTQELAQHVLEIPEPQSDPKDNALWQQRAKEAFKATGSRVLMDLIAAVEQDIYYASWYGIKKAF